MRRLTLYLRDTGTAALESEIENLRERFDEHGVGEARGYVAIDDATGEAFDVTLTFGDPLDERDDDEDER